MWTVVVVIGALVVAWLCFHFGRGIRQAQRESGRRDLMALHEVKSAAQALAEMLDGAPAYAFAPPRAAGRHTPIGWLWWRTERNSDGRLVHDSGWTLTYRRARKAAGAPVKGSAATEVMVRL